MTTQLKTITMTEKVIVTKQDTDIDSLAKILNQEQISELIGTLCMMDKICIPQYYSNDDQARHYGFKNLEEMNHSTNHLYQFIDEMVMDIEL